MLHNVISAVERRVQGTNPAWSAWRLLGRRRQAIVLIAFLGLAVGDFWGMPSEITTAFDASSVYSSLALVSHFTDATFDYAYPQVHKVVLLPVVSVVMLLTFILGGMGRPTGAWPYGLSNPVATITALFVAGILVSNAMALVALVLFTSANDSDHDDMSWGFTLLFLVACGPIAYYARTMNYDFPYLFWWALSWWLIWKAHVHGQTTTRSLIFSGVFAAFAVGTKDQAAGLALGGGAAVLALSGTTPVRLQRAVTWGCAAAAGYLATILISPPNRWWYHVQHMDETLAGAGRTDPSQYPLGQLAKDVVQSLAAVLGWPSILLAIAGVVIMARRRAAPQLIAIGLPILGYLAVPIVTTRVGYTRFLLPVALLLVPAIMAAIEAMFRKSRTWTAFALASLLLWRVTFSWAPMTWLQTFDVKRSLAADLSHLVPQGEVICYFDEYRLIPNADVYTKYRWWRPTLDDVSRPAQHIFLPIEPARHCKYILSVVDHGPRWKGLAKTQTWQPARWLRARIAAGDVFEPTRSTFNYYLYQD